MQRIIDPTTIKRTRLAVNTDAGTRASEDRQPAPDSPPAAKQIRGPLPRRHSPAPEPRALSDRNDEPGALSTLDRLTLPGLSALPTAAASLSPISYTERPSLAQVMKQGRGSSRRQRPVRQQTAASRPLLGGYPIITTPLIPALPLMASAPPSGPADNRRCILSLRSPHTTAQPLPGGLLVRLRRQNLRTSALRGTPPRHWRSGRQHSHGRPDCQRSASAPTRTAPMLTWWTSCICSATMRRHSRLPHKTWRWSTGSTTARRRASAMRPQPAALHSRLPWRTSTWRMHLHGRTSMHGVCGSTSRDQTCVSRAS